MKITVYIHNTDAMTPFAVEVEITECHLIISVEYRVKNNFRFLRLQVFCFEIFVCRLLISGNLKELCNTGFFLDTYLRRVMCFKQYVRKQAEWDSVSAFSYMCTYSYDL